MGEAKARRVFSLTSTGPGICNLTCAIDCEMFHKRREKASTVLRGGGGRAHFDGTTIANAGNSAYSHPSPPPSLRGEGERGCPPMANGFGLPSVDGGSSRDATVLAAR